MAWIKAKNGNVFEVADPELADQLVSEGHEAFASDPREKGAKVKPVPRSKGPEVSES